MRGRGISPEKLIQWVQERYELIGTLIDEPAHATVGSRRRAGFDHLDSFVGRSRHRTGALNLLLLCVCVCMCEYACVCVM
jgi:hypothetical protein